MTRSLPQRISLVAAVLFGAAPLGVGFARLYVTGFDTSLLWMALVPSLLTGGILAATIGRRRTRSAVRAQSLVIFCLSTLFAGTAGWLLEPGTTREVWAMSLMLGLSLAASSVFVALARPNTI